MTGKRTRGIDGPPPVTARVLRQSIAAYWDSVSRLSVACEGSGGVSTPFIEECDRAVTARSDEARLIVRQGLAEGWTIRGISIAAKVLPGSLTRWTRDDH